MKLAAEYQQKPKSPNQYAERGRNYIVRLGQGVPDQKRKRGISLSQNSHKGSDNGSDRNSPIRNKYQKLLPNSCYSINSQCKLTTQKTLQENQRPLQQYSVYPQSLKATSTYADQHLINYQEQPQREQNMNNNKFSKPKLQIPRPNISNFNDQPQQKIIKKVCVSPYGRGLQKNKISQKNIVAIPNRGLQYTEGFESRYTLREQPLIINYQLYKSNPVAQVKSCSRSKQYIVSPKKLEIPQNKQFISHSRYVNSDYENSPKKNLYQTKETKISEKLIEQTQSRSRQIYSKNSKIENRKPFDTNKLKDSMSQKGWESEMEQPLVISKQLGGTVVKSLWDANKTESILSMKESKQLMIEQSQIMLDFFNPTQSQMKRV